MCTTSKGQTGPINNSIIATHLVQTIKTKSLKEIMENPMFVKRIRGH